MKYKISFPELDNTRMKKEEVSKDFYEIEAIRNKKYKRIRKHSKTKKKK